MGQWAPPISPPIQAYPLRYFVQNKLGGCSFMGTWIGLFSLENRGPITLRFSSELIQAIVVLWKCCLVSVLLCHSLVW